MDPDRKADVTLMLEGTYPYVLGGVSAWVDQIIRGLPEITFALYFIGSRKDQCQKAHYKLPPNVVSLTETYLFDPLPESELQPGSPPAAVRYRIYDHLAKFYNAPAFNERCAQFWNLIDALKEAGDQFTFGNLCRDPEAWQILRQVYESFAPEESFIDFFWTARFLHLPLWCMWRGYRLLPKSDVYHSISTGYAGMMGAIAARSFNAPYIVTEHGIYTKERIAEISQAEWIHTADRFHVNFNEGLGKLKQMWIELFMLQGRIAYDTCDQLVTLYQGNAYLQVEFGADWDKIRVIPNGIEPGKFDHILAGQMARWESEPKAKNVGFIGRVVPIKDVKTLLRAARVVCEQCPTVEFLIAGPYSEDPNYFEECQKIAKLLQIDSKVHFMGMQKIMDVLPKMDVIVLTSISEGLPLVILEGMAAGIPMVATDVGACRELIFGRTQEDKALGRAGGLTKILSPLETANALIQLLNNPEKMRRAGLAGRKRVEEHYSMTSMLQQYRDLYRGLQRTGRQGPKIMEIAK